MKLWWVVLLLHAVCWICYHNAVQNDFTFDDHMAIVGNADTSPGWGNAGGNGKSSPEGLWFNDLWGKDLRANDSHRSYRPLLIVLFRLLRSVHDSPQCLRIVSIELHAIACTFVYVLGCALGGHSAHSAPHKHRTSASAMGVALGAALLFAAHPVHVEAVTAIVNCAEAMHAIFFMFVYYQYCQSLRLADAEADAPEAEAEAQQGGAEVQAAGTAPENALPAAVEPPLCPAEGKTEEENKEERSTAAGSGAADGRLLLGLAAASIGILFKETTITVYGVVLAKSVLDLLPTTGAGAGTRTGKRPLPWVLGALCFIAGYFVFRVLLLRPTDLLQWQGGAGLLGLLGKAKSSVYLETSGLIRKAENPYAFLPAGAPKATSYMYLHFRYMWLLLWPAELCPEYAFDCVPSVTSMYSIEFLQAVCLYTVMLALLGIAVATSRRAPAPHGQFMLHAWLLLVVPFVPASGVFLRLGTLLAERLLYVPSVGFCLLVAKILCSASTAACGKGRGSRYARVLYAVCIAIVCIVYGMKTRSQNTIWQSDSILHMHSLRVCPKSAKANLQVAKLKINEGKFSEAKRHIDAAKSIDPDFCDVGYQEALVAIKLDNDLGKAIDLTAKNLNCVFTSMNSMELLGKLFDIQQEANPGNVAVLEYHGDVLAKSDLPTLACQKYHAACLLATQQKALAAAVQMALKLEQAFGQFSADESLVGEGATSHLAALTSHVPLLGGLTRLKLQGAIEEGHVLKTSLDKPLLRKLADGKKILVHWVVDQLTHAKQHASAHDASIGVDGLLSSLVPKARAELAVIRAVQQQRKAAGGAKGRGKGRGKTNCLSQRMSNIIDYAYVLGGLQSYNLQLRQAQRASAEVDYHSQFQASNLWLGAGKVFLDEGLYNTAQQYFAHAVEAAREAGEQVELVAHANVHYCAALYFRAQALMEMETVHRARALDEAVHALLGLLQCRPAAAAAKAKGGVGKELKVVRMVARAEEQLRRLLQIL